MSRIFLALVLLLCPATAAELPNIVFILADDLGAGDLGCYNSDSKIPTPNLDELAAAGMRFTNAHTPAAVCTPTRYGLMTGRYPWRTWLKRGVLDGISPPLIDSDRMTVASLLKSRGYNTACVGKWHLGMQWTGKDGASIPFREAGIGFRDARNVDFTKPVTGGPNDAGFDYYFGISASLDMSPYCFIENRRSVGIPSVDTPLDRNLMMNQVPGITTKDFRLDQVLPTLGKKAVEFVNRQNTGKPFFLYLPLNSPHLPIVPRKEFEGRSKAGRYGDFVVETETVVGSLLEAIDEKGFTGNTLVIFSSDNGGLWHWWEFRETDDINHGKITDRGRYVKQRGHQSNGPLRGTKSDIWEGGHRVPFIVRWPGRVAAGSKTGELVSLVDFLATCAEIVGAPLPAGAGEDSFSILPILDGGNSLRHDAIYQSGRGMLAIQSGKWKFIEKRGSGGFSAPHTLDPKPGEPAGQLYDMSRDPSESVNLYLKQPEVVKRLEELLRSYQAKGRSRPN